MDSGIAIDSDRNELAISKPDNTPEHGKSKCADELETGPLQH